MNSRKYYQSDIGSWRAVNNPIFINTSNRYRVNFAFFSDKGKIPGYFQKLD